MLATSGVLARHPDPHVVLVEFNIGWVGWSMEMDYYDTAFRRYDEAKASDESASQGSIPIWTSRRATLFVGRCIRRSGRTSSASTTSHTRGRCPDVGQQLPARRGHVSALAEDRHEQAALLPHDVARKVFLENALEVFQFERASIDEPV
jgi:hypothetical protein